MRNKKCRIVLFLTFIFLVLSIPTVVFADEDGVTITLTSDKVLYRPYERAVFTITVTNNGDTLNGISVVIAGTNLRAIIEQSAEG